MSIETKRDGGDGRDGGGVEGQFLLEGSSIQNSSVWCHWVRFL